MCTFMFGYLSRNFSRIDGRVYVPMARAEAMFSTPPEASLAFSMTTRPCRRASIARSA